MTKLLSQDSLKWAFKNIEPKNARIVNVVRSPKEAAIGVATLSGFIWSFFDKIITKIIIPLRTNEANEAVTKLLAHNKLAWVKLIFHAESMKVLWRQLNAKNVTIMA